MSKQYENDAVAGWAAAERPDDAEAVRTVNSALHLVAAVEPELDETLAGSGLTRPSFRVLAALRAAPERRLSQRELSAAVRRTSGTISVRIARLEHARLITREPDPDDRRGVIVTLTDRGARRVEGALPAYAEVCRRLVAGVPEASREGLADGLAAWVGFFEEDRVGGTEGPRLGVAVAPAHVAARMRRAVGLPERLGVLVRRVRPGSAAHTAGVAQGDLVVRAGGAEVRTIGDLHRAVAHVEPGATVELGLVRGVEERTATVVLPDQAAAA